MEKTTLLKVRKITGLSDDRSRSVVSTLVNGIMARFAKDDAIIQAAISTKLDMADVMGLGTLTVQVA